MKKNINLLIGFVVLGGIAVVGAVWFKKNKPNTSNLQSNELTKKLNSIIGGGAENIDKPFNIQPSILSSGVNQQYNSPVVIGNFTPAEIASIKTVTDLIPDINFSNIKIK